MLYTQHVVCDSVRMANSLLQDIPLGASLTEEAARAIFLRGEESVIFALLAQAKMLAEHQAALPAIAHNTPSTPSGAKPVYAKPQSSGRGKKKPGRKAGHAGSRRPAPEEIDRSEAHRAACCPDCGGSLNRCEETRTRYTEDIPETRPEVTEHVIHRDWCPRCKKKVEAPVSAALPGATVGNRALVLSAWLHYCLGNSLAQIADVFNFHLYFKVTPGGLLHMWRRLAEILLPWHEEIQREALRSSVLNADETGWRVDGKTHWLWCFASSDLSYFLIDQSRGQPALKKFFIEEFAGTLVADFWGPYNAVACAHAQKCLVHLLRDLEHVERYKSPGEDWAAFAKKLRRLLGDAIRLSRREDEHTPEAYASRRALLSKRLDELNAMPWEDAQARRLVKRLKRHCDELFTFLDRPGVPFENNLAERSIRPAVLLRKNSYGNRSGTGADIQALLMSVFFTLKKRGHNPVDAISHALKQFLETGSLPPLPAKSTSVR